MAGWILFKHVSRCLKPRSALNSETVRFVSHNRVKPYKPKKQAEKPAKDAKLLQAFADSISSRGYLRPYKPYEPSATVANEVSEIATQLQIPSNQALSIDQKFSLLKTCFEKFNHGVPNSQIHELQTVADVVSFYETPIDTRIPLDAIKTVELPENLHIQYDYVRFHPETDTMFGGRSAFPKSSTMVTGVKYKDKYRGHVAKKSWP